MRRVRNAWRAARAAQIRRKATTEADRDLAQPPHTTSPKMLSSPNSSWTVASYSDLSVFKSSHTHIKWNNLTECNDLHHSNHISIHSLASKARQRFAPRPTRATNAHLKWLTSLAATQASSATSPNCSNKDVFFPALCTLRTTLAFSPKALRPRTLTPPTLLTLPASSSTESTQATTLHPCHAPRMGHWPQDYSRWQGTSRHPSPTRPRGCASDATPPAL